MNSFQPGPENKMKILVSVACPDLFPDLLDDLSNSYGSDEKLAPMPPLLRGSCYAKVTSAAHSARALLRVERLSLQRAKLLFGLA
jgi:hypothetical protein